MGHLNCDSWLIHLNEGWDPDCVVTFFWLVESESVINKSHRWNNLYIDCLVNLSRAHHNYDLNSSGLDQ